MDSILTFGGYLVMLIGGATTVFACVNMAIPLIRHAILLIVSASHEITRSIEEKELERIRR